MIGPRRNVSTRRTVGLFVAGILLGHSVTAQSASAQSASTIDTLASAATPGNGPSMFAPLALAPAPSQVRLANGAPGPKYWQNRADYDLHATLDTVAGVIAGTMTLRYTNHSPDTLAVLWFQTEQNAFRDTSAQSAQYGDRIDRFTEVIDGKAVPLHLEEHQSETKVTLSRPLGPGKTAVLDVAWHFVVPPRATDPAIVMRSLARATMSLRMGRDGSLYRIAQWYPRVNVYDDVKGWNTEPYTGGQEFYLEYGDYTMTVTVPANYIVAATGTLENPQDVLTPIERGRLMQAAHADTVIHVVSAAELADGTAHLRHDGMVTWKFHAANVRDAVFAASTEYQWDATSWNGILAQAYYRPAAASMWAQAADMAKMSIQEYGERWYPYPYPQISVAEANTTGPLTGGMEYPMMSFNATMGNDANVYSLLTHEIGHNWFPMIVGSNERTHEWMDEGLNTFINSFSNARRYPERTQEAQITRPKFSDLSAIDAQGDDSYNEPAYALELLRRDILGPQVFDSAFRVYIRRWAYKHPTPADFFRTINDVSGSNLDWFWREWFEQQPMPRLDQSIDTVQVTSTGNEVRVRVVYRNKGTAVAPLLVRFTFSDSATQSITYRADLWKQGPTFAETYTFPHRAVTQIWIDPQRHFFDIGRNNNRWLAK